MSDVENWTFWGGWAAVIGGFMWSVKAGVILFGGDQPGYLFELAPLAFGIAFLALHSLLYGRGGKLATAGQIVAVATILATVATPLKRHSSTTSGFRRFPASSTWSPEWARYLG